MLIGITGAKGVGKDTLAETFIGVGFINAKMAAPLKDMLRVMYEHAGYGRIMIEAKVEGSEKETPCTLLGGQTPRHAMQTLGTEWRNMIDTQLWTRIWHNRVADLLSEGIPVVCTDIRFRHEAAVVHQLGGHLIRIERPGLENDDTHSSEQEMRSLQVNKTIVNDGSVRVLHKKAMQYLEEIPTNVD